MTYIKFYLPQFPKTYVLESTKNTHGPVRAGNPKKPKKTQKNQKKHLVQISDNNTLNSMYNKDLHNFFTLQYGPRGTSHFFYAKRAQFTKTYMPQGTKLAYKAHIASDSHKGVITSVSVSSSAQDDTSAVPQLLSQHCDLLDKPKPVVADSSYGSEDCLGYLQSRGIETVIKQRSGGNKHGGFDKSEFSYNVDEDYYVCPAGRRLSRTRTHKTNRKAYYSCDKATCRSCSLRSQCIGSTSPDAVRTVT